MDDFRKSALMLVLAIVLISLTACPGTTPTTPAAPADPPQITVLKYTQLAAAADNTAAHTLVVLCTQTPPVIDLGTCNQVKTYLTVAAQTFDKITAEANSTDAWAVMRVKIAGIAATATTTTAVSDPTLRQQIAALQSLITQILEVQ